MKILYSFLNLLLAASLCGACVDKENKRPGNTGPDTENPAPDTDPEEPGTDGPDPAPDLPAVILEETFASGQGAFTIKDVTIPSALKAVWAFDAKYGMKATAYLNETRYEAESWLISPEVDLSGYTTAWLTFDHTGRYFGEMTEQAGIQITSDDGETWNALPIPNYPSGSDWNFVHSGDIDLSAYCGNTIQVAFIYKSNTTDAPTWEIKNVRIAKDATEPTDIGNLYTSVPKWLELPAVPDPERFRIHTTRYEDAVYRNYSFCYDSEYYVATWVAYPLCDFYTSKKVSRSENWYIDPFVSDQAILARSGDFYANGYERGHQIPSADRLRSRLFNDQTFYYTNATPQLAEFNGNFWATFEKRVRDWSAKSDTLYVLTGCVVGNDPKTVEDNVGKKVAIPEAYFKAVLRYDKSSGTNGGFSAFAAYVEHKKDTPKFDKAAAISLDTLEEKLGLELFVNLSDKIGKDDAAAVKAADPAKNSFWWN